MTKDDLMALFADLDAQCSPNGSNWKGYWTKHWQVRRLEVVITTIDEYGEPHDMVQTIDERWRK